MPPVVVGTPTQAMFGYWTVCMALLAIAMTIVPPFCMLQCESSGRHCSAFLDPDKQIVHL